MARQDGTNLVIKIGDGGSPENFTTLGGLLLNGMSLSNNQVEIPAVNSGSAWRQILMAAGRQWVRISGSGEFEDSTAEETLRGYAFAGSVNNYELLFANGDKLSGAFIVSRYEREGNAGTPESYNLTLESAGDITFTAA